MMAADECPTADNTQWCSGDIDHFDFNEAAFPSIAPLVWGVTFTSIRPVVCPTTNPVSIITGWASESVSDYFLQVHFFNHKVPLQSVRVHDSGASGWTSLPRTDYNAFEYSPSRIIGYPVTYELTSTYGEKINVSLASKPNPSGQKIDGTTQFTQWTTVSENDCPSFYEYNVYMDGLNNGGTSPMRRTAQHWQTVASANLAYTASLPSNATRAAQYTLDGYQEWGFFTAGSQIPVSTIAAVEVQLRSPGSSITGLQLMWGEYSDGFIVDFPTITSSWQHFYFTKSEFGSAMGPLSKLAFKNGLSGSIALNVANFRILPDADSVTSPSGSPPSGSPPSGSPPSGSPPSGSPPSLSPPSGTPSDTAPTEGPSGNATTSSLSSIALMICAASVFAFIL
jgi:hypothetical protein